MRDPKRIHKFCEQLEEHWNKVPDWRFGQLISNVFGSEFGAKGRDIFFPEENEMMAAFDNYFRNYG